MSSAPAPAQAIWSRWSLADRLELLMRWRAAQSPEVQTGLSLLPVQALAAGDKTQILLPDGRRQIVAYGPVGVVKLSPAPSVGSASILVQLVWACALGNAVLVRSEDKALQAAVAELKALLVAADPALASLTLLASNDEQAFDLERKLRVEDLHAVVAPSADVALLIEDATHAGQLNGLVLWVNHSLHHEVKRRLPTITLAEQFSDIKIPIRAGDMYLLACGAVDEQLRQLQRHRVGRTALYSGDWSEVESACDTAMGQGSQFAVNTLLDAPLGLLEARSMYQQPSVTVVCHAKK